MNKTNKRYEKVDGGKGAPSRRERGLCEKVYEHMENTNVRITWEIGMNKYLS